MKTKTKLTEIGEIPEDWEVARLVNIITFVKGKKAEKLNGSENGLPYLSTEYLRNNKAPELVKITNNIILANDGDLILLWDGSNAGEFFIGKKGVLSSTMVKFEFKNNNVDKTFLFYFLKTKEKILSLKTRGTGIPHVDKSVLENLKILLPQFPEQHAIAQVLSAVDEAIQKVNEIIAKTERLKRGLLHRFFKKEHENEKFVQLSTIFDVENGTTPSTREKKYWDGATINWITPVDLGKLDGKMTIEESERKISHIALKEVNLTLLPKGTIILSTRAPVGHLAILKKESTFNQGCKGLVPKNASKINVHYYGYYLLMEKYNLQNKAGQSTFKELSTTLLKKFEVPEININKQNNIVKILSTVDQKLALEDKKKEKLERVKKGLMSDLLTGRKRVNIEKILVVEK